MGEVARRLGHSVEGLVSTYVGALHGDDLTANRQIEAILGSADESHACNNTADGTDVFPLGSNASLELEPAD